MIRTIQDERLRRATVVIAGSAAVISVTGVAFAGWSSNASGNAAAKAATINYSVVAASAPTAGNLLRPGSVAGTAAGETVGGDLVVRINNTSGFPLKVVAIQQTDVVTPSGGIGTCSADTLATAGTPGSATTAAGAPTITASPNTSGVAVGTSATLKYTPASPITVPTGTNDIVIPNALSMSTASVTGCQSASFSVPVQVQAST